MSVLGPSWLLRYPCLASPPCSLLFAAERPPVRRRFAKQVTALSTPAPPCPAGWRVLRAGAGAVSGGAHSHRQRAAVAPAPHSGAVRPAPFRGLAGRPLRGGPRARQTARRARSPRAGRPGRRPARVVARRVSRRFGRDRVKRGGRGACPHVGRRRTRRCKPTQRVGPAAARPGVGVSVASCYRRCPLWALERPSVLRRTCSAASAPRCPVRLRLCRRARPAGGALRPVVPARTASAPPLPGPARSAAARSAAFGARPVVGSAPGSSALARGPVEVPVLRRPPRTSARARCARRQGQRFGGGETEMLGHGAGAP